MIKTLEDKLNSLNKFEELYKSYNSNCSNLDKVFPYWFDGSFGSSVEFLLDFLIQNLANSLCVPIEALSIHIYDQEFQDDNEEFLKEYVGKSSC